MSEVGGTGLDFEPIVGYDEATIDSKGRILIPKKKRDRLGSGFVMTLGDVGCICAYPKSQWMKIIREIMSYNPINQGRQQYSRLVLGMADDDLDFDPQGRVVVPARMRKLADIESDVLTIGCGDRLEIWGRQQWVEYNKYTKEYGKQRREAIAKAYELMTGIPVESY